MRLYAHYTAFHSCINSPKQYHPVIMNVTYKEIMREQYQTYAYFLITNFDCDPKDISDSLGLIPDRVYQKNDLIRENGTARWKHSGWELRSSLPESTTCQDMHIENLLNVIYPKKRELLALSDECEFYINCVGYYYGANPGFHLSSDIIKSCADLGVSIDFDLYNNDEILKN